MLFTTDLSRAYSNYFLILGIIISSAIVLMTYCFLTLYLHLVCSLQLLPQDVNAPLMLLPICMTTFVAIIILMILDIPSRAADAFYALNRLLFMLGLQTSPEKGCPYHWFFWASYLTQLPWHSLF